MRQPTIFLPHGGGPCFFMEWTWGPRDTWAPLAAWLGEMVASLPERPRALLVVSAHWEAPRPTVTTSSAPPLLFDYSGFPLHTYLLSWPAPGDPALAARVRSLLAAAGIPSEEDPRRGYDHGVFVPLKVALPEAEIPTVQLSLVRGLDPGLHLAMGHALAPLRDEGVLIIGSGMSYHAMDAFFTARATQDSARFDEWLDATVAEVGPARDAALAQWAQAPAGRASHPREEHLLPLMVAAGAGGGEPGRVVHRSEVMGARISAVRFG